MIKSLISVVFLAMIAMGCVLVAALLILAAIPLPGAKKRYTAFMREITDEE